MPEKMPNHFVTFLRFDSGLWEIADVLGDPSLFTPVLFSHQPCSLPQSVLLPRKLVSQNASVWTGYIRTPQRDFFLKHAFVDPEPDLLCLQSRDRKAGFSTIFPSDSEAEPDLSLR